MLDEWDDAAVMRNIENKRVIAAEVRAEAIGCTRSHPHENMSAECEAKTVEARRVFWEAQERVAERIAQITAHRACCGTEHDPANGKLHGYCVVCGVPWPCDYAGSAPQPPAPCPAPLDESHYCPDCDALQAKVAEQSLALKGLRQLLTDLVEYVDTPPDRNCSCHISPPCSDCVDNSHLRGLLGDVKAAVTATKPSPQATDLRDSYEQVADFSIDNYKGI